MSSQWHYIKRGNTIGPVSEEKLSELIASGILNGTDLVWCEGLESPTPIRSLPEFMTVTPKLYQKAGKPANSKPLIILAGTVGIFIVIYYIFMFIATKNSPITCAIREQSHSKEIIVKNNTNNEIRFISINYDKNQSFSLSNIPPGKFKATFDLYAFATPEPTTTINEYHITYEDGTVKTGHWIPRDNSLWSKYNFWRD